jgi:hypothetical protein
MAEDQGPERVDLKNVALSQAASLSSFEAASPVPIFPMSAAFLAFGNSVPAGTLTFPKFVIPGLGGMTTPGGQSGVDGASARRAAQTSGVRQTTVI